MVVNWMRMGLVTKLLEKQLIPFSVIEPTRNGGSPKKFFWWKPLLIDCSLPVSMMVSKNEFRWFQLIQQKSELRQHYLIPV